MVYRKRKSDEAEVRASHALAWNTARAIWNGLSDHPKTFEELFPMPGDPEPYYVQEALETAKKLGKPIPRAD